jgi:rhodanese-related sulfurtransferase
MDKTIPINPRRNFLGAKRHQSSAKVLREVIGIPMVDLRLMEKRFLNGRKLFLSHPCYPIMKSNIILFTLTGYMFTSGMLFGQSIAFKTLLKTHYDKNFPLVYPEQRELLNKAVLLDTREPEEFAVSQLKNAKLVGYDSFDLSTVKDIPKTQPIVVYCSIGARSQDIGKRLVEAGYQEVYNLYGGIFHWVNQGNPVYDGEMETPKVHAYSRTWGIWLNQGEKVY